MINQLVSLYYLIKKWFQVESTLKQTHKKPKQRRITIHIHVNFRIPNSGFMFFTAQPQLITNRMAALQENCHITRIFAYFFGLLVLNLV